MLSTHLFRARNFRLLTYGCCLILSFVTVMFLSGERAHAGAAVACQGNNLQVSWDSLNAPVTVRVNGADVVTGGPSNGSTLVGGPGSWTVEIFQNGDLVSTHTAGCPTSRPAPRDPNRIDNGSDAGLNVPFKRKGGGFDLYTYNPRTQTSTLLLTLTCEQQTNAAKRAAQQHGQGQTPNVHLFTGKDYQRREVTVWFVYPDQIQVNGYFDDGKPHSFNFAACVDARQFALPTPTPRPALPILSVVVDCNKGGLLIHIFNTGGDMTRHGDYAIFRNRQIVAQGQIRLSAGQSTAVVYVFAGSRFTAAFIVTNPDAGTSFLRVIDCVIPPSRLAISGSCPNGVAAFVVKNVSTTTIRLVEYGFSNVTTSASLNSGILEALNPGESRTINPTQGQHGIVQLGIHDVDDREIRAERITCTQLPKLTVTASCPNGIATFVVTNVGLGELSNTSYFITTHNPFGRRQFGGTLELKAGQSTTITTPKGGGAYQRATFAINVGDEPVSAETSC